MRKSLILFIGLFCSFQLFSQFSVSFLPWNEYFFTQEQVWNFTILNTGKHPQTVSLEINLLKNGSYPVMKKLISNYKLERGANSITVSGKSGALTFYGNDATSSSFQSTGILPPGNYALCITIKNSINQVLIYSCRELQIKGFTLPILQSPYNTETIHTTAPLFTWLPVMPATTDNLTYKIEIWKKSKATNFKTGGNLFETTLSETNFQYYSGLPLFENGKSYSWKVSAYSADFYLGCSELWDFTVNTTSNAKIEEEEVDSYRALDDMSENANYTAENILRIKYFNMANDSLLDYSISLLDNPDSVISELPEITLNRGLNKIDINLEELGTLSVETNYLLEVYASTGRKYFLKFLYTEL